MNRYLTIISEFLTSSRVQLAIVGLLLTWASKNAPGVEIDEASATKLVGLIVALIVSQINRPLSSTKGSVLPVSPPMSANITGGGAGFKTIIPAVVIIFAAAAGVMYSPKRPAVEKAIKPAMSSAKPVVESSKPRVVIPLEANE